jgi:hypothetical protein
MSDIGATKELANDQEEISNIPFMVSSVTERVTRRERVNIGKDKIMIQTVVGTGGGRMRTRCRQNRRIKYIKRRDISWVIIKLFVLICGEDSGKRDELWDNVSFVINSMQGQSSISYRAFQFLFPLIACAPP